MEGFCEPYLAIIAIIWKYFAFFGPLRLYNRRLQWQTENKTINDAITTAKYFAAV